MTDLSKQILRELWHSLRFKARVLYKGNKKQWNIYSILRMKIMGVFFTTLIYTKDYHVPYVPPINNVCTNLCGIGLTQNPFMLFGEFHFHLCFPKLSKTFLSPSPEKQPTMCATQNYKYIYSTSQSFFFSKSENMP